MAMSMSGDTAAMKEHWVEGQNRSLSEFEDWLDDEWSGYGDVPLDPVFTTGDDRYFDVINRSKHGNTHIDLSVLWSRYYNIEMVDGDRTGSVLAVVTTGQGGPSPGDTSAVDDSSQPGDSQTGLQDVNVQNDTINAPSVSSPSTEKAARIDGDVILLGVGALVMGVFAIGTVLFAVGTITRGHRIDTSEGEGFLWDPGDRDKR